MEQGEQVEQSERVKQGKQVEQSEQVERGGAGIVRACAQRSVSKLEPARAYPPHAAGRAMQAGGGRPLPKDAFRQTKCNRMQAV